MKNGEKMEEGSEEGKVGWHASKWLRADCLGLGGNWQPEDLSGQEVSADHLCGRVCVQTDDREGGRDTQEDETHLSLFDRAGTRRGAENNGGRLKVTGCVRAQWGNTGLHKRRVWVRVRDTDGQEERGREWQREGGKAVGFPPPFLPASSAVLAVPRSGEERLPKPSLRLHVWTQSLPLPCSQMALLSEYKPMAVWPPPRVAELLSLDLARKM